MGRPAAQENEDCPAQDDLWGVPLDAVEVDDPAVADQVLGAGLAALALQPDATDDLVDADLGTVASLLAVGTAPQDGQDGGRPAPDTPPSPTASRRGRRQRGPGRRARSWSAVGVTGFVAACLLVGGAGGLLLPRTGSSAERATPGGWPGSDAKIVVDGPSTCPMYVVPGGTSSTAPPDRGCFVAR